jgi:2-C-methyl-D-erythritol 4-phosphate cytidylyltransferase/2-C-methyl-D-erythritol 2,4-cyclodiphosphate synthase
MNSSSTSALIVAAGRGERAPGDHPKQYRLLGGKPVLRWVLEAFAFHPAIDGVRVVLREEDRALYADCTAGLNLGAPIIGGATRQLSVRNGLEALAAEAPERVLIHDGARPFVSPGLIAGVVKALDGSDAAIPLLSVVDTLRRKTESGFELMPRDHLRRAQTPQSFVYAKILAAHRKYSAIETTDDMTLAEHAGLSIAEVAGEEMNLKLTSPEDFALAERIAAGRLSDIRTGSGYDVHKFSEGDHVWLCGVKVPHVQGLKGHSDADVGLHALTDAILGAIGAGDIGVHFPPSDPQWRGAPSHIFLAKAASLVAALGGAIAHVDVTLICERPKVTLHREAMRARIAEILNIDISRVSVKATTTEGLGFTGRGEGIAAQGLATVRLP